MTLGPPGDPGAIRTAAQQLAAAAGQMDSSSAALASSASTVGAMQGNGPQAFVTVVTQRRHHLEQGALALRGAAEALVTFASALEDAQHAWNSIDIQNPIVADIFIPLMDVFGLTPDPKIARAGQATAQVTSAAAGAAARLHSLAEAAKPGPVQNNPSVHPVFLGSWWKGKAASGDKASILSMLAGLRGSPLQSQLGQYRDQSGTVGDPSIAASILDGSKVPSNIDVPALQKIAQREAGKNGWKLNGDSQVMVFAPPGTRLDGGKADGFHATAQIKGREIPISIVTDRIDGRPTTDPISHEYAETVTDPLYDSRPAYFGPVSDMQVGSEIGDLCNGELTPGPGGVPVQKQWDQSRGNCR